VLSATAWLICDLVVSTQGLVVYQVRMLRVEPIGNSAIEHRFQPLGVLLPEMIDHMLDDGVDREREQDALAQRLLMEQRRNVEPIGLEELLDQSHQLLNEVFAAAGEAVLISANALRAATNNTRCSRNSSGSFSRSMDTALLRSAAPPRAGAMIRADVDLGRIELEHRHLRPIDTQGGVHDHIDPQHIGPADLQLGALLDSLDLGAVSRRRWRIAPAPTSSNTDSGTPNTLTYSALNSIRSLPSGHTTGSVS
jgi:hypothetical protein